MNARFAANLRATRKAAGLTQQGLADACDLQRSYVSRLERGELDPRLTMIVRLADALGVSLTILVEGGDGAFDRL
jgi:transcriptional regulator with XRE-family HTH domain